MRRIFVLSVVIMLLTLFSSIALANVNFDTQYNGHSYKIFDQGMTWQQAKKYCEDLGGHLVTITSSQEQAIIVGLLRSKGNKNSYWLGGYYENDRNWHWITNEDFSYTNWGRGQPDYAFGRENCLMIYKGTANGWPLGDWNDLAENGRCDPDMINFFGIEHFGFICEWDSYSQKIVTIPDGWYRIQPMHDLGRSIDALGSQIGNGNNIYVWTNNTAVQQKFYLQNRGNGYFSLKSDYGNKLYVTASGRGRGANLYTSEWNNSDYQLFKLVDAGNNSYHIFAKVGSNLNFDCEGGGKSDGNNVQLWTSEDNPWHKWRFTKVSIDNKIEIWKGEVEIKSSKDHSREGIQKRLMQAVFHTTDGVRISKGGDFDGYIELKKNYGYIHEGIDLVLYHKAPVYSVISGEVIRAGTGYGNTVAIYDKDNDVTAVYLHFDSVASGIYVGKKVDKNTLIGYQGNKDAPQGSHVHIEIRVGKQKSAATSSNTYQENPDPYPYWDRLL